MTNAVKIYFKRAGKALSVMDGKMHAFKFP